MSDITRENVAVQTNHYVDVFVYENVAHVMTLWRYDVRKFNAEAILFEEKQCKKNVFTVISLFSVNFCLESGKICKNNDHSCLFHSVNTCRVPQEMFEDSA